MMIVGPYFFSILSFIKLAIVDFPDPDKPVIQKEYLFFYLSSYTFNKLLLIYIIFDIKLIMPQNIKLSINDLERIVISKNNRYKLNIKEKRNQKTLYNQNILIVGACGSIGKLFTKKYMSIVLIKFFSLIKMKMI